MLWFGNKMHQQVIQDPYDRSENNNRTLYAITGYASSSFVQHILSTFSDVNLHLIIGMARRNGILRPDHDNYLDILNRYRGRFYGYYYTGSQAVHAKAYVWESANIEGIIGSANFTNNGMRHNYEVMHTAQQPELIIDAFNDLRGCSVKIDNSSDDIQIVDVEPDRPEMVASSHGSSAYSGEEIKLSLLTRTGEIHNRSGLNWGQREKREPNQAHIPVPGSVHTNHPGFLPGKGEHFTVITDDGKNFVCTIAQDGNKAIETPHNNSLLGKYFRARIGLVPGKFVRREDLQVYGRTDITLRKLDDDMFFLDFSV